MVPLSSDLLIKFRRYAQFAAGFVIFCSILVLIGWATNNVNLQSLFPAAQDKPLPFVGRVHASAAISFILCSISLLLILARPKQLKISGYIVAGLSLIGSLIGTYVAYTGEDFEPIRLFQPDEAALGITYPVPTVLEVGITMSIMAIALLLLRAPAPKKMQLGQIFALLAIPIPLIIILSAATQIEQLCDIGGCFKMSIGFAVLALILCSAIFLSRPYMGFASVFSGDSTGSALLRRAALFICLVPLMLIGRTLCVYAFGMQADDRLTWVFFVFGLLVLMIGIVASGVSVFNRVEHELSSRLSDTRDELEKTRQSRSSIEQDSFVNTHIRYKRICLTCTREFNDSLDICPADGSPLNRVLDDALEGVTFAEKYQVIEQLGAGGMSTVYRAKHLYMNKDVAIKVLKGNTAASNDGVKRFMREARATSAVEHPGIVGVSDFGLAPDGRAYLVMDYLEGESLSAYIDRYGHLSLQLVAKLAAELCDALAAAHEKGVIHRDLKPSNVMIVTGKDGVIHIKIVDFGLAKILEEDGDANLKITTTGEAFGSPLYMSPEQCMGKKLDHRTDIYALGCILFECLTGFPPIMGSNAADTIRKHVTEKPAGFPQEYKIPPEIQTIIYKALHKEPSWRPNSVLEISQIMMLALKV